MLIYLVTLCNFGYRRLDGAWDEVLDMCDSIAHALKLLFSSSCIDASIRWRCLWAPCGSLHLSRLCMAPRSSLATAPVQTSPSSTGSSMCRCVTLKVPLPPPFLSLSLSYFLGFLSCLWTNYYFLNNYIAIPIIAINVMLCVLDWRKNSTA